MNVGIIGSGGREHAICYMLNKSKKVSKIFCFPGNAGTGLIAQNINLDPDNFSGLEEYCIKKEIKLLINFFLFIGKFHFYFLSVFCY